MSSTENKLLENSGVREAIDAIFMLDSVMAKKVERFISTIDGPANIGRLIAGLHALHAAALLVCNRIAKDPLFAFNSNKAMDMVFDPSESLSVFDETEPSRIAHKCFEAQLCFRQAKMLPVATEARKHREELLAIHSSQLASEPPAQRAPLEANDGTSEVVGEQVPAEPKRSPKRARAEDDDDVDAASE